MDKTSKPSCPALRLPDLTWTVNASAKAQVFADTFRGSGSCLLQLRTSSLGFRRRGSSRMTFPPCALAMLSSTLPLCVTAAPQDLISFHF
eukprot:363245-Alexandrium_andersonii.AAC.1